MADNRNASPREALTFDDVLIRPGLSEVLPSDVDLRSRITRSIPLNLPIIASAMDTVTESQMAIAMAQAGGLGVIHRNMEPHEQAAQVRQVKKFESGMVVNPLTISPQASLQEALDVLEHLHETMRERRGRLQRLAADVADCHARSRKQGPRPSDPGRAWAPVTALEGEHQ